MQVDRMVHNAYVHLTLVELSWTSQPSNVFVESWLSILGQGHSFEGSERRRSLSKKGFASSFFAMIIMIHFVNVHDRSWTL